jgi:radical SAM superfamily enzyme
MADSTVKNGLIEPMWSAEKMKSIKYIHEIMDKRKLVQGSDF